MAPCVLRSPMPHGCHPPAGCGDDQPWNQSAYFGSDEPALQTDITRIFLRMFMMYTGNTHAAL